MMPPAIMRKAHTSPGAAVLLALLPLTIACGDASGEGLVGPGAQGTEQGGTGAATGGMSGGGAGGVASGGQGATGGAGGSGGAIPESCDSDNDCTPFGLLCDRARGRCVECLLSSDCSGDLECRGGVCAEVVPCVNSLDCVDASGDRTVCDPAAGECVQCVRAADCPAQAACRDGMCEAAVCAPSTCDGRCGTVPDGCGGQLECAACGTHCSNGVQDVDESGVDCGGAECPACMTPSGDAWAQCLSDADCGGGRICSKDLQETVAPGRWGFCSLPCTVDAECTDPAPPGGEPPVCLGGMIGTGVYCAIPCQVTSVCPDGMECLQGLFSFYCRHPMVP